MFTNYFENLIMNHVFGGAGTLAQATWYIGLLTAAPSDAGGGTECTGGAYARKATTNNTTNFPTTTTGAKSLGVSAAFDEATNNWGTISHWGLYDAASGGNLCCHGALVTPTIINQGDVARIAAGSGGMLLSLD